MIYKKLSLSVLLFAAGFLTASAQKSPQDMDRFIDVLMNKMTLEEKIGQLNLPGFLLDIVMKLKKLK